MIPKILKIIIIGNTIESVIFKVYRLDDNIPVMDLEIDFSTLLKNSFIYNKNKKHTPLKEHEFFKNREFFWERNENQEIGLFYTKPFENKVTFKAKQTELFDLKKIKTREIKENNDPNSIQQKLKNIAKKAELDKSLEDYKNKYCK